MRRHIDRTSRRRAATGPPSGPPQALIVIRTPSGEDIALTGPLSSVPAETVPGGTLDLLPGESFRLVVDRIRIGRRAGEYEVSCRFEDEAIHEDRRRQRNFVAALRNHIRDGKEPRLNPPDTPIFGWRIRADNLLIESG